MVPSLRGRKSIHSQSEFVITDIARCHVTILTMLVLITALFLSCIHGDNSSQVVFINEIDLSNQKSNNVQLLVYKLATAPTPCQSRHSPLIAKCFGPYMNSKVSSASATLLLHL